MNFFVIIIVLRERFAVGIRIARIIVGMSIEAIGSMVAIGSLVFRGWMGYRMH